MGLAGNGGAEGAGDVGGGIAREPEREAEPDEGEADRDRRVALDLVRQQGSGGRYQRGDGQQDRGSPGQDAGAEGTDAEQDSAYEVEHAEDAVGRHYGPDVHRSRVLVHYAEEAVDEL